MLFTFIFDHSGECIIPHGALIFRTPHMIFLLRLFKNRVPRIRRMIVPMIWKNTLLLNFSIWLMNQLSAVGVITSLPWWMLSISWFNVLNGCLEIICRAISWSTWKTCHIFIIGGLPTQPLVSSQLLLLDLSFIHDLSWTLILSPVSTDPNSSVEKLGQFQL